MDFCDQRLLRIQVPDIISHPPKTLKDYKKWKGYVHRIMHPQYWQGILLCPPFAYRFRVKVMATLLFTPCVTGGTSSTLHYPLCYAGCICVLADE